MAEGDNERVDSNTAEDDCRKALRAVINARFTEDIGGSEWATVIPSDPLGETGLNSSVAAWRETIRDSVRKLRYIGHYQMKNPTQDDIDGTVDQVLNASLGLLYDSIETRRLKGPRPNFTRDEP